MKLANFLNLLLQIYSRSIFQRIRPGFKQAVVPVKKNRLDKYNIYEHQYIRLGNFFSHLFALWFFSIQKVVKGKLFAEKIFSQQIIIFSIRSPWETTTSKRKPESEKSDTLNVIFPDKFYFMSDYISGSKNIEQIVIWIS